MSVTRVGQRLRAQVLADAGGRCGYCRSSEEIMGAPLEIEHVVPRRWEGQRAATTSGLPADNAMRLREIGRGQPTP